MPRRRRKALPAASRSPAIAPRLSAPRPWRRHCGPRAYRRIRFRPRRRRRMPAARPIASRFSCCHDDDRDRTILVKPALKIAVAGLGTVGAGTLQLLARQAELLAVRAGRRIVVAAVSARDRRRDRGVDLSAVRWYEDAVAMTADPEIDVVVELIGGAEGVALNVIEGALNHKKHIVTANKALMAEHGTRLAARAEEAGVALAFEAAVAGGIPVIKTLRESLAGNRLARVYGILNGTSNYILTTMRESGREFAEVLAEAQKLGYAEADPSFDIDGVDAAHKLAILASVAFGRPVDLVDIAAGRQIAPFGVPQAALAALPGAPMERHQGAYFIRLMVVDQPGVIADIAAALRDEHVSMEAMIQRGRAPGEAVPVVLTTHVTVEAAMQRAIERIAALDSVLEPPRMIRIEDF